MEPDISEVVTPFRVFKKICLLPSGLITEVPKAEFISGLFLSALYFSAFFKILDMRKLLLFWLILPIFLAAQTEKGAAPLSPAHPLTRSPAATRAVVVGISDYQHNGIPDLNYAHRDAEAFADWLHSPAGGSVPEDNIILLTNEKATITAVGTALFSMLETSKPGERFLFYFSGHGDVEKKTITQPGYLLCHDSPANVYMVGALNLRDLQEIVSTISGNGAQVVLITDACHAGKLAGESIGGTQATAAALQKQVANEIKIMSCQPNEFSLEGRQWGGGRGVFSFSLLDGLSGLSDKNGDGAVNLFEITRYLQDEVTAQTAPHSQIPMSLGDLQTVLNTVDAATLSDLKSRRAGIVAGISNTGSKGLEDEILAKTDSLTRQRYLAWKNALAVRAFFEPEDACADAFFRHLIAEPVLEPLRGLMTRNYAVALLDEVQQALNALLDNDPYEANSWRYNPEKYAQYPAYLQRGMELLGEKHYMYRALAAKKLYFEGYNLFKRIGEFQQEPTRRDSFKLAARDRYLESLNLQPEAAYACYAVGQTFSFEVNPVYQPDSVEYWCRKAIESAPGWLQPYLELAHEYGNGQIDLQMAEKWLKKALAIAPESYMLLERLSWLKQWQDQPDESIAISKRMIALKPDIFNAWSTMAHTLALMKGEHLESERCCLKSLELEPNQGWWAGSLLGVNYIMTRRTDLAIQHLTRQFESPAASSFDKGSIIILLIEALIQKRDWAAAERYCQMGSEQFENNPPSVCGRKTRQGKMYLLQNRLAEAKKILLEALEADPTDNSNWPLIWVMLGEIEAKRGDTLAAASWFQFLLTRRQVTHGINLPLSEALFRYGCFLLAQNRPAEADVQFREIGRLLPKSFYYGYGMALVAASRGKQPDALDWLEKALDNFWPDAESIRTEPLFKKLRKTNRFISLIKKHFPDQVKD